jgi:hypothetical protein
MSGQGKRWPGEWQRGAAVERQWSPEWLAALVEENGDGLYVWAAWARPGRLSGTDLQNPAVARTDAAPTEAEAMAAADEALFQMLVGVGPWTDGPTGWFRGYNDSDDEGDQAVVVRRAIPPLTAWEWFAYKEPGDVLADPDAKGEADAALLGRIAADVALRRLAGYPDDATTPPPATEPTPAPAPEPAPAPPPLLADGPEPTDPEALYWCIQARMMLAHVADGNRLDGARDELGTPIPEADLIAACVATLRQYGQHGTAQAFEAGRLAQHQAEERARQEMAEAVARREAERLPDDPDGVAMRIMRPTSDQSDEAHRIAQQAGLPESIATVLEASGWIVIAWPNGDVAPQHASITARATREALAEFVGLLRAAGLSIEIEPYDEWRQPA